MGTNVTTGTSTDKSAESRRRIIESARQQVESKGILGLRVQDVARNAGVSVPLIYKYFGDRDGLLAEVLGEMFVDCSTRRLSAAVQELAAGPAGITVDQLVRALITPQEDGVRKERALTLQTLAAAAEIPALASMLEAAERTVHSKLVTFIAAVFDKLDLDDSVPVAPIAMLVQAASLGLVYNDMLGEQAVDEDDVAQLVRVLVESVVERHTARRS